MNLLQTIFVTGKCVFEGIIKGLLMKKNIIRVLAACMALALMGEPVAVEAATVSIKDVTPQAGVSVVLTSAKSTQEYIETAKEEKDNQWGYTNLGVANVNRYLNVRAIPGENGKIVGKMPKNAACEVISVENNWAQITSGEVSGYVSMDYLLTGVEAKLKADEVASMVVTVNAEDGLRIRTGPSTESECLTVVLAGTQLDYVETVNGWHKVTIDNDEAYVSAEYADVTETLETAVTLTELLYGQGVSDVRVDMVEYSKQFLGNPYVWGGTSLTKGADCSGFVQSIYKKYGINISRTSRAQANEGTKISIDQAKPGDLIFYSNSSGTINHVAMYIGGGNVIHASSPKSGIKISKYNYRTPCKVVRIIND